LKNEAKKMRETVFVFALPINRACTEFPPWHESPTVSKQEGPPFGNPIAESEVELGLNGGLVDKQAHRVNQPNAGARLCNESPTH
jgi:hypothetical protein